MFHGERDSSAPEDGAHPDGASNDDDIHSPEDGAHPDSACDRDDGGDGGAAEVLGDGLDEDDEDDLMGGKDGGGGRDQHRGLTATFAS